MKVFCCFVLDSYVGGGWTSVGDGSESEFELTVAYPPQQEPSNGDLSLALQI